MKFPAEYAVHFLDADGNFHSEYFQAPSAQQAADFSRDIYNASQIISIYKEVKNWK